MSPLVEIQNTIIELVIETDIGLQADDLLIRTLYDFLEAMRADASPPPSGIRLLRNAVDPRIYAYRIERMGGSQCDEVWTFANNTDLDPAVSVDLADGWELSILDLAGAVRKQLVAIRAAVGIVRFEAIFLG